MLDKNVADIDPKFLTVVLRQRHTSNGKPNETTIKRSLEPPDAASRRRLPQRQLEAPLIERQDIISSRLPLESASNFHRHKK
jgi:hypothetical protein